MQDYQFTQRTPKRSKVMNLGCHLAVILYDFLQPHSVGQEKQQKTLVVWINSKLKIEEQGNKKSRV